MSASHLIRELLKLCEARPHTIRVGRTFTQRAAGSQLVPFIRLAGHWLADAGFEEGDTVRVTVARGEIRLIAEGTSSRPLPQGELFA
jgi:anaerobic selenocysteine-containing dehydrogenase